MDNCFNASKKLLELLKVNYTLKYLKDNILSHPDHPSLLAISDTFNKYIIDNVAIKIRADKFDDLPVPCIVQVTAAHGTFFYVLEKITNKMVSYYNHDNKLKHDSKGEFIKKWTGICLLTEKSEISQEIDIEKKLFERRTFNALLVSILALLLSWTIISFSNSEILVNSSITVYAVLYSILKLIGLTVGVFLLWFEIDQFNPTLQSFCTGGSGSKINCNAVLGSKYAKLFNGFLSISLLSFAYFFGTLLFTFLTDFSLNSLALLSTLSFITIPVVLISIYYQAIIIKQWCKFCIIIQVVLVSEIAVSFFRGFYKTFIDLETIPLLLALILIPILGWKILKPLLELEKESNVHKRGLKKIKSNPNVLEALLYQSRKIETSTEGLGITLDKEAVKYDIIKVCNPYCGPCAKAHPILEELMINQKINLQILFTAKANKNDRASKPVSHFLAIDAQGDQTKTQTALNDWYNTEKKDYNDFAIKYLMNGELEQQKDKINAMRKWCDQEKITHTPTIFINGYELPKEYSVADLKEVLQ